ncbi:MAG: phospho-N-acetylmuramoyl-pentapeptide-transferase [bacterium]
MFYHLLYPLKQYISVFNVFRYITFRTAYATVTSLFICFVFGPMIIRFLRRANIVNMVRQDTPDQHAAKSGTPTMGGLLIILATVVPTLLWANLANKYVLLCLVSTCWLGVLGFMDDYLRVVKRKPAGLVGRYKIAGQALLGLVIGTILLAFPDDPLLATKTTLPFFKNILPDLGILYIPFVVIVITGTSNAVNLADGLDGLAIGMYVFAATAFAGLAYVSGHAVFSDYLNILYLRQAGELTVFCGSLVGASLGFLWFNAHPAEIFMGDTGSLALGGALATVAVLIKKEILLPIVCGMFVMEALSVIIQVICFRLTGKRIFKMAPLHHHFELKNWPESRVVVRFWILSALMALVTLSTLKLR